MLAVSLSPSAWCARDFTNDLLQIDLMIVKTERLPYEPPQAVALHLAQPLSLLVALSAAGLGVDEYELGDDLDPF